MRIPLLLHSSNSLTQRLHVKLRERVMRCWSSSTSMPISHAKA